MFSLSLSLSKKTKKEKNPALCSFPSILKLIHVEEKKKKIRIKFQILISNAGLMSFISKPQRLSGI